MVPKMKDSKPIQVISFLLIKNLFPLRFCPVTALGSNSNYYPFKVKVLHYSPIFKSLNTSIPYYNLDKYQEVYNMTYKTAFDTNIIHSSLLVSTDGQQGHL